MASDLDKTMVQIDQTPPRSLKPGQEGPEANTPSPSARGPHQMVVVAEVHAEGRHVPAAQGSLEGTKTREASVNADQVFEDEPRLQMARAMINHLILDLAASSPPDMARRLCIIEDL